MKPFTYLLLLLLFSCNSSTKAQDTTLSKGAALLFKNSNSTLSNTEKNSVFESTGFAVSQNNTQFYMKEDENSAQFPFDAFVYPVDVNADMVEEIGITYGNTYVSGAAGVNTMLLIKDSSNNVYKMNLGYPGFLSLMPSKHKNFSDMMIQGPGFEYAVWQWDGNVYKFNHNILSDAAGKLELISLEQASKLYIENLKQ